ncbi:hypothetical protein CFK41_11985 [Brachybacterium ginsengisoli]|uniref:ESX secretion-associated protein EspG n=1 Tax=Brachybacterium ginsengisoli TaxID=1331682 RepID=A0A291GYW9_9MICO|nr:hypothetical protein [Brachybacterium ginsengisoli]ATG55407.1 hypothetical protein CFK41_11985 [Brachybacterium ginsengisoli]
MVEVIATVPQAARWALSPGDGGAAGGRARRTAWNPVYRVLVGDGPDEAALSSRARSAQPSPAELDLLRRHLASPALLVAAVTAAEHTHRVRFGLDPAGASTERSDDTSESRWGEVPLHAVPQQILDLLEESGPDLRRPGVEGHARGGALRLSEELARVAQAALAGGPSIEAAFTQIPDMDEALRDAVTTTGPRLSLSLTLHDRGGVAAESPVTWSRLWVQGQRGLYRLDSRSGSVLTVRPVASSDVLDTLLPILEQGVRFSAACSEAGGAR